MTANQYTTSQYITMTTNLYTTSQYITWTIEERDLALSEVHRIRKLIQDGVVLPSDICLSGMHGTVTYEEELGGAEEMVEECQEELAALYAKKNGETQLSAQEPDRHISEV